MTIQEINHELLRTQWIIDTTKNPKCKKEHIKHFQRLKLKKERLIKENKNGN